MGIARRGREIREHKIMTCSNIGRVESFTCLWDASKVGRGDESTDMVPTPRIKGPKLRSSSRIEHAYQDVNCCERGVQLAYAPWTKCRFRVVSARLALAPSTPLPIIPPNCYLRPYV